jgi:hypothetical protein
MNLDMFPSFARAHVRDSFGDHTKGAPDATVGFTLREAATYFGNGIIGQLCHRSFHALIVFCSSFLNHILHIVVASARNQMGRINAGRIIARMHKDFALWNLAFMKGIRKAVGFVIALTIVKAAISKVIPASCPKPTGVGFMDVFHEALDGISSTVVVSTRLRTIDACSGSQLAGQRLECLAALKAVACYFGVSHLDFISNIKLIWLGSVRRSNVESGCFYFSRLATI